MGYTSKFKGAEIDARLEKIKIFPSDFTMRLFSNALTFEDGEDLVKARKKCVLSVFLCPETPDLQAFDDTQFTAILQRKEYSTTSSGQLQSITLEIIELATRTIAFTIKVDYISKSVTLA